MALDFPFEVPFEVKKLPPFTWVGETELAPTPAAAAADELARCWFEVNVVLAVVVEEPAKVEAEAEEPGVAPEGCF